jgi:hypothetical protein
MVPCTTAKKENSINIYYAQVHLHQREGGKMSRKGKKNEGENATYKNKKCTFPSARSQGEQLMI